VWVKERERGITLAAFAFQSFALLEQF